MNCLIDPDYKPSPADTIVKCEIIPSQDIPFSEGLQYLIAKLNSDEKSNTQAPAVHFFDPSQEHYQCMVAFPDEYFETNNIAQILSVLSGEIFDTGIAKSVKLLDINFSKRLQLYFPGPAKGISEIRKILKIKERPLSSVVLKPKAILSSKDCIERAYHIWMGGCDIVEENETMASSTNSDYYERIQFLSIEQNNCTKRTKHQKLYIPNITAGTIIEMQHRAKKAKEAGLKAVTINAIQVGFTGVCSIQKFCQEIGLILAANRSGHSLYTRNQSFRISMKVLAIIYRHLGIDMLHVGSETDENTWEICKALSNAHSPQADNQSPCFPVCTKINHIDRVENIVKYHGHDTVLQAEDCVYLHPDGIKAGAEAFHFAVESAAQGIDKEAASDKNEYFKKALAIASPAVRNERS